MSILDNTSAMNHTHHVCGGTILQGPMTDDGRQNYCDRCGAFSYGDDPVPSGQDARANQAASDAGRVCSPEAAE